MSQHCLTEPSMCVCVRVCGLHMVGYIAIDHLATRPTTQDAPSVNIFPPTKAQTTPSPHPFLQPLPLALPLTLLTDKHYKK